MNALRYYIKADSHSGLTKKLAELLQAVDDREAVFLEN